MQTITHFIGGNHVSSGSNIIGLGRGMTNIVQIDMNQFDLFLVIIRYEFSTNTFKYPALREIDVETFLDHLSCCQQDWAKGVVNEEVEIQSRDAKESSHIEDSVIPTPPELIIPIEMVPLLRISLSCLIFRLRNGISNDISFLPNRTRNHKMVEFVHSIQNSNFRFHSFQVISFHAGVTPMNIEILKTEMEKLLEYRALVEISHFLISLFVNPSDDLREPIVFQRAIKKDPTRGFNELYFLFLDIYLEKIDSLVLDIFSKNRMECKWFRVLNIALLCFHCRREIRLLKKVFSISEIAPVWGLTAQIRSGTRGGRVLRPLNGKLFLSGDGRLHWISPDSVLDVKY